MKVKKEWKYSSTTPYSLLACVWGINFTLPLRYHKSFSNLLYYSCTANFYRLTYTWMLHFLRKWYILSEKFGITVYFKSKLKTCLKMPVNFVTLPETSICEKSAVQWRQLLRLACSACGLTFLWLQTENVVRPRLLTNVNDLVCFKQDIRRFACTTQCPIYQLL